MAPTTTSFFFSSFDITTFKDLELQGDACLCADRLSLTKHDTPNSAGLVLYSPSIKFSDTHGELIFDTVITFKIDNPDGWPTADGIAFFIAPAGFNIPQDASGGSLAIFDPHTGHSKNLFAVEFATYKGKPRINFDVESRDPQKPADFEDYLGKEVTATISYRERRVTVMVAVRDTDKVNVYHDFYDFDLKSLLNQDVQVGVSASSGNFKENHYVYSWSFNSVLAADKKSGGSSK